MSNDNDSLPLYPKIPRRIKSQVENVDKYIQQSNYSAAVRVAAEIPKKYQSYPQVLEAKWCALHSHRSHQEAYEVATFFCQEYPNIFWSWLYKAESLAYLKRFDEAVAVLIDGGKTNFLPNANLKIATYRYAQGRHDEALAMLRDIIAKDPAGHAKRHAKSEPLLAAVHDIL